MANIIYETESEFRKEIEHFLNRPILDDEWKEYIAVKGPPPYFTEDIDETLSKLRKRKKPVNIVKKAKKVYPKKNKKWMIAALTRSALIPEDIQSEVRDLREKLFNKSEPPFDNLLQMQEWIYSEAKAQTPNDGYAPQYGHKLDLSLSPEELVRLIETQPGIYGIERPMLQVPHEKTIGNIPVYEGSNLWHIWCATQSISKVLDCQEAQATAYILTGLIPVVSPISYETPFRGSRLGNRVKIVITIREPISDEVLIETYRRLRKKLWGVERNHRPPNDRDSTLVMFVRNRSILGETPQWEELRKEWSRQYPEWAIDDYDVFRMDFTRADKRIYPPVHLGPLIMK